jgi:IS30 family transposase
MVIDFSTASAGRGQHVQPALNGDESIETLHRSGHSNREIARLLSIDRGAVNKRVRQIRAESQAQKESDSGPAQFKTGHKRPPGLRLPNSRRGGRRTSRPQRAEKSAQ